MRKNNFLFAITSIVFILCGCGRSTDKLIHDLNIENPRTRLRAATALIGRRDKDTTSKLIKEFEKNDDRLTFIVTQILGDRADTSAVQSLGNVSRHANPHIRARAMWSIGSIGNESGIPYLVEGLKDSVAYVRHAAVQGIGYIHHAPAARYLYPMLRDEADSVRTAAIQSIHNFRRIKDSGVLAADLAVSLNDPSTVVRYVAVQALGGGFPDTTVAGELLVEALRDENKDVRVEAIVSIQKIRYKDAIPVLKRIYDTASIDEEYAISEAISDMTGETYPPETEN